MAAKFVLSYKAFFFIWFISTENKNLHSLYYALKYKIYVEFWVNVQTCSHKIARSLLQK